MNAARSYTHTTGSGFLILYGLFVLQRAYHPPFEVGQVVAVH